MSVNYQTLPTEQRNPRSKHVDRVSLQKLISIMNKEDASVASVVKKATPAIEKAILQITSSLKNKGRLFFIGAGTSGRLGVIEAAECPPTFGTPPSLVQALMAGGKQAVFRSKEGDEDKGSEAQRIVRKKLRTEDILVGIAASGVTPYVRSALLTAKKRKIKTILVTCHPGVSAKWADVVIALKTGPEVVTGSTRLKAGTATKLVLNMLTVGSMVQLGKVYGHLMVDVQPKSKKLVARAVGLISYLGDVSEKQAQTLLRLSKKNVKTAIVMARKKVGYKKAAQLLRESHGHLYRILS